MIKAILFASLFINNFNLDCNDIILKYHSLILEYYEICQNIDDNKLKYCKSISENIIELEDYLKKECNYEYSINC